MKSQFLKILAQVVIFVQILSPVFAVLPQVQATTTEKKDVAKVSALIASQPTKEKIVIFERPQSKEELKALEEKFGVSFTKKSSKSNRAVVTSDDNAKLEHFLNEPIIKENFNVQTYKISAQTVSWGNHYVSATAAQKNTPPIVGNKMVIAIIDTGVQLDHPDLVGAIQAGGYDFVNDDADPIDDHGHGTHIAGIIAARNNTIGTLGVAYGAKILPLKACDDEGNCDSLSIADAVDEAVAQNVDVINMSLGGAPNELVQSAINRATSAGIIVAAAAGNTGASSCLYPGGYSNVVCVGAIDSNEAHPSYSNYGTGLDVVAPGSNITSLGLAGGTATMSGTSMATAYYSGVIAVVRAIQEDICTANPAASMCSDIRGYTQFLVNNILIRDIGDYGFDQYFGTGAVDLGRLFLKTTVTYLNLPANINQNVAYLQQIDVRNNNNFSIALSSCKVRGDNPYINQTRLFWTTGVVVAPSLARRVTGTTLFESQYSLATPYTIAAGATTRFNYAVTANSDNRNGDKIDYLFTCIYDDLSTPAVETYALNPTVASVTVAQPDPVDAVYYRFSTLQEGQTVSSSSLYNNWDTLTLYNFDASKMSVVGIYVLDKSTNGLSAAVTSRQSATTYRTKTSYMLPAGRNYSYVVTLDNTQTGKRVYKFFNFSTAN